MTVDGESGCTVRCMRTRVLALAVLTAGLALVGGETAHAYPTDSATPAPFQPARPDLGPGRAFSVCYPLTQASPELGRRECFLYYAETGQLIPGSGVVGVFDQGPDVARDAGPQGAAASPTTPRPTYTPPAPATSPRTAPAAPATSSAVVATPVPTQSTPTTEAEIVTSGTEAPVATVGSTAVRPVSRPYAAPAAADRDLGAWWWVTVLTSATVLAYCLVKKPVVKLAGRHRRA